MNFNSIDSIVQDLKNGKCVIITDDEDRENEGDLVALGSKVSPEVINFMSKYGRGLICAPMGSDISKKFELESMVSRNSERYKTDFKVSVDASHGITTGISAKDRALTISLLADKNSKPSDIVKPGHIFPLGAVAGGVLRRAGHTEASVDLAKLAGEPEVGVICEIIKDDGEMARLDDLFSFAKKHDLKICSIEELIKYRSNREKLVELVEKIDMPTKFGDFKLSLYKSIGNDEINFALTKGEFSKDKPVLTRVHSECLTGDILGSLRCDCGDQLNQAMINIENEGSGVIIYMRQEGRGIGLLNKIKSYKLQEQGYDTVEANEKLGFPPDLRDYGIGAQILKDLGVKEIKLMTNNPKKVIGLEGHGLKIIDQVPIKSTPNIHNSKYLETKKNRMGHFL